MQLGFDTPTVALKKMRRLVGVSTTESILRCAAAAFLALPLAGAEAAELAQKPPMGWNSFDSYGVYLHEKAAMANLEAMGEKLKPHGYEYFVIDNGWFGEYRLQPGTIYPAEKHASDVRINEFGLLQPSECYFPHGLEPIIERCHALGLKFGVHLMRGIPRKAVSLNIPIEGTPYRAKDIADVKSVCTWCDYNYGVDMARPGAQEFYDSLVRQLARWGVDFIKADDIVPYPQEVVAMARAIEHSGRPIVLSLSPGGAVDPNHLEEFRAANMLRVTHDIWDNQKGLDACFAAWRKWQGRERPGFWIDMDMIPFGQLALMSPSPKDGAKQKSKQVKLAGQGYTRLSEFSPAQKRTFVALRALAASPLFVGGDLPTMPADDLALVTNADILACNQNGVMGELISEEGGMEIWRTFEKARTERAWIGLFNRSQQPRSAKLSAKALGLADAPNWQARDLWSGRRLAVDGSDVNVPAQDVLFLRVERQE